MNAKELIILLESLDHDELEEIDTELFKQISEYHRRQINANEAHKMEQVRTIIRLIKRLDE